MILIASEQIKDYIYICKKYNFVSDEGIDKINDCNTYNILNEQMRERMFDRKYYYTYIVSTILEKGIFEIEEEKFNQLKEYYVKHFIANKECNYEIGENMKLFLYENVNMTDLNKEQLKRFITLPQKKEIISAVIDTDDNNFINYYLSNINDISSTDYDEYMRCLVIIILIMY